MSFQLFLMDKILRFSIKRRLRKEPNIMTLRSIMDELARQARPAPAPLEVSQTELGGVPVERLAAPGADDGRALLYIHGGGFVAGGPANSRPLTWRLARRTGVPVYAVDYRLAPENPFPAGLEDCLVAYRALLISGLKAGGIAIAGDSAGGNLTLATALKLKDDGSNLPACLVCLSPVTDMAEQTPSHHSNAKSDALFDTRTFATAPALYCPNTDPQDPLVSPLRADVTGLPPTLFQCGQGEMLRDDSISMAKKMKAAGIDTTLEVWPDVFHAWQLTADFVPEARAAIETMAAFIRARLARIDGAGAPSYPANLYEAQSFAS